ncbi:MAG TPA: CotH kinase family protein, partial [Chitinophagales bacterium]|nr:CotH kinase family protein [Chitinophagales bacterium]
PKGFLLVWCDKDLKQDSLLHANLKLDADGESLYLLDKNGKTLIDSIRYPKQYLDFSYGRIAEGKEWSYFLQPSPLKANSGSKIEQVCPAPGFPQTGSFYQNTAEVSIIVPDGYEVYYTTDGSEPQAGRSKKYEESFWIDKTTVVCARAFREGFLPGAIVSKTFFINEKITLPVASIITHPHNLWDPAKGIYANPFRDLEVPARFEYFQANGSRAVSQDVALKIFGNTSRGSSKQSFAILAKEKFGDDRIRFPFFADKPQVKSVDGIVLRGDVTSGRGGGDRETAGERIKNELMYHLIRQAGGHCDVQAYQPVVLFLNGNYWGLYNLMERKGKDFIKNNYGIDSIDMLNSYRLQVVEGDTVHYQSMLDYVEDVFLEDDDNFSRLNAWIDMESLMDYWIFEIYSATHDYSVNIRMWRPRTPEGKWRWIAFDEDSWGKYHEKTFGDIASEEEAETIFLIGKMLENEGFRNRFINRFADLLNTVLQPNNIKRLIDEIQDVIKDEKERDYQRWKNLVHFVEPGSQVAYLKEFAEKRPAYIRDEIIERFKLTGLTSLLIDVEGNGKVAVNTVHPEIYPWSGTYFQDVPVTLTAIPDNGHRFIGWSDKRLPQKETAELRLSDSEVKITARFD